MQGMAVFSEKIEMEEAGFSEKMKKDWRGSSESCQDAYEEVFITMNCRKKKVARCHEKIRNKRRDHLQNSASRKIANSYDAVAVVEDIDMKAMGQCLHFGKAYRIMDMDCSGNKRNINWRGRERKW